MALKAESTLRSEAQAFLRWRRRNGGSVEDLRGKRNGAMIDRAQYGNNSIIGLQQGFAEVDVMFEYNFHSKDVR